VPLSIIDEVLRKKICMDQTLWDLGRSPVPDGVQLPQIGVAQGARLQFAKLPASNPHHVEGVIIVGQGQLVHRAEQFRHRDDGGVLNGFPLLQ
jgi:hypothetical protein